MLHRHYTETQSLSGGGEVGWNKAMVGRTGAGRWGWNQARCGEERGTLTGVDLAVETGVASAAAARVVDPAHVRHTARPVMARLREAGRGITAVIPICGTNETITFSHYLNFTLSAKI